MTINVDASPLKADKLNCGGIYIIRNKVSDKPYIGSTTNFNARKRQHWSKLRNGKHGNARLQNSWNVHGEQAFVFGILEITNQNLTQREKYWMDVFDSTNHETGYNILSDPVHNTLSQEVRNKISRAKKGKPGVNRGRKFSTKARKNMSEARKALFANGYVHSRLGAKLTPSTKKQISTSLTKYPVSKERLVDLYISQNLMSKEIAKILGYPASAIRTKLSRYSIHKRS